MTGVLVRRDEDADAQRGGRVRAQGGDGRLHAKGRGPGGTSLSTPGPQTPASGAGGHKRVCPPGRLARGWPRYRAGLCRWAGWLCGS